MNSFAPLAGHVSRGLREGALFVCGAIALYLLVSLLTYHSMDPGWSHSGNSGEIANRGGITGAWFADVFFHLFGYFAYLFPIMIAYNGWLVLKGHPRQTEFDARQLMLGASGFLLLLGAGTGLATLQLASAAAHLPQSAGGILGFVISEGFVQAFNFLGANLFLLAMFLTGVTLVTGLSWLWLMDAIGRFTLNLLTRVWALRERFAKRSPSAQPSPFQPKGLVKTEKKRRMDGRPALRIEPTIGNFDIGERLDDGPIIPIIPILPRPQQGADALPPLNLLDPALPSTERVSDEALEAMSRQVEMKLKDFGIVMQVVAVQPGPVITRFELQPMPGLKVSQVTNLAKDLARSLSVVSVRVVEVIPGKPVIGLEIPNEQRSMVRLSETLQSKEYEGAASPLTLALGKGIGGQPVVVDLAKMPHLLVAGTTGSGKSVAINAMILSLLYNAPPSEVRLIMIDPKMLELSVYEGIPHLLAPVVVDMKEAANALRWCVAEMERRYRLMAALGVRNLAGFNARVKEEAISDPFRKAVEGAEPLILQPLPNIVVLIDELADMMMTVGKKVEELIARLAQKARASGIHLILATQRPSVDVITGLIKANIPSRIAFQVSSKIDSRTILDQMGAEQLLGHGDMLYLPAGTSVPVRIHGAFVADHEVHRVVDHLKEQGAPDYLEEVLQGAPENEEGGFVGETVSNAESDPLYDQALHIVTETRRASISGVQRRLKIGYNRAARLIEDMEQAGVVGSLQSNGMREVLAPPPPKG